MLPDGWWCLSFHVLFNSLGAFVQEEEGFLVHPSVDCCLVVNIGAIYHEVGVGMVLVVDDVVVREGGQQVLDESVCESRLMSELLFMLLPLLLKEGLEVFEDAIVVGK